MPGRIRQSYTITGSGATVEVMTDGVVTAVQDIVLLNNGENKRMEDFVTPGFKKLQRHGSIINNSCSSIKGTLTCDDGPYLAVQKYFHRDNTELPWQVFEQRYGASRMNYSRWGEPQLCAHLVGSDAFPARFATLYPVNDSIPAGIQQLLIADCLAKAASSDALLLVSVKEFNKTVQTVESYLTKQEKFIHFCCQARDYVASVRKRPKRLKRDAIRLTGALASEWLEYRYGLMQLYYDFKSFSSAAGRVGASSRRRFVSTRSYTSGASFSLPLINTYDTVSHSGRRTRKDTFTAGCLVQAQNDIVTAGDTLGVDRILMSTWELIPFSFVLDWFADTSNRIAAFEGRYGQKVLAKWFTHRVEAVSTIQRSVTGLTRESDDHLHRYVGEYNSTYAATERITQMDRIADPSLSPLPELVVRLNWKKFTDLAALFSGCAKRIRL